MIIQIDARERQSNITKYFDEIGQKYVISKMIAGDYQDVSSIDTLIDLKQSHGDGIAEICMNLTRTTNHERLKKEVQQLLTEYQNNYTINFNTVQKVSSRFWFGKIQSEICRISKTYKFQKISIWS